tara:strand:+ start:1940 stop:3040 length:1101 start_codon:yes stop_codon:yes gene_type:complete
MAFSLQGFGAGFASKLTDRLDEERTRQEKLQDEATSIATRQRLAKQAKRDEEKRIAEETIGMLTTLGYTESQAGEIAKSGKLASDFWVNAGQQMLLKGGDPSTLLNISSKNAATSPENVATETIEAGEPADIGGITTKVQDFNSNISGTNINLDVYKEFFGKPDKIESTFSSALAKISQKLARDPERQDADALKQEQAALLADLEKMKTVEREKTGTNTESYTLSGVSTAVREVRANSLSRFGFKLGLNDTIDNMESGQEYLADIANISAVSQLNTRNSKIQSDSMGFAIRGLYDNAKVGLADYAFEKYNSKEGVDTVTTQDFVKAAASNQYRIGQVFKDTNNLYVYTGYIDPFTGMPFMSYAIGK